MLTTRPIGGGGELGFKAYYRFWQPLRARRQIPARCQVPPRPAPRPAAPANLPSTKVWTVERRSHRAPPFARNPSAHAVAPTAGQCPAKQQSGKCPGKRSGKWRWPERLKRFKVRQVTGPLGRIRTPNLLIRSQVLYPIELPAGRARRVWGVAPRPGCGRVRRASGDGGGRLPRVAMGRARCPRRRRGPYSRRTALARGELGSRDSRSRQSRRHCNARAQMP